MRYVMAGLAVLTCPCHLPVMVALLGGTAAGAVLVDHLGWAALMLGVVFLGSAWASVKLFARRRSGTPGRGGNMAQAHGGAARAPSRQAPHERTPGLGAVAKLDSKEDAMTAPTVTVYYSPT